MKAFSVLGPRAGFIQIHVVWFGMQRGPPKGLGGLVQSA